jgi:hypothetical protein
LLARRNPLLRIAARLCARDPAWLLPTALALLDGAAYPVASTQASWRESAAHAAADRPPV